MLKKHFILYSYIHDLFEIMHFLDEKSCNFATGIIKNNFEALSKFAEK